MKDTKPNKWKRVTKNSPAYGELVWIHVRFNFEAVESRRGFLAYRTYEGEWRSIYPWQFLIDEKKVKVWTPLVVPSQPPKRFGV